METRILALPLSPSATPVSLPITFVLPSLALLLFLSNPPPPPPSLPSLPLPPGRLSWTPSPKGTLDMKKSLIIFPPSWLVLWDSRREWRSSRPGLVLG